VIRLCDCILGAILCASLVTAAVTAVADDSLCALADVNRSTAVQSVVDRAAERTLSEFAARQLKPEQLAVTLVDLTEPAMVRFGSYHGDAEIYPASVIKLFYLAAAHRWMEDGKLQDSEELRRAMRDMIVQSYNEATGYIVDLLTGTTSGPELSADALAEWWEKRNAVQRYFAGLGYSGVLANRKPWCEGPYGREVQAMKQFLPKSNHLTTDSTARIMFEIVSGRCVSPERSKQMMELLKRDPYADTRDNDDQAHGFTALALLNPRQEGARLWSKAGWTSQTRHDAAYLELADNRKFILVVFTTGHASEREIIPSVCRSVLDLLRKI
jgi:hypothetical protein